MSMDAPFLDSEKKKKTGESGKFRHDTTYIGDTYHATNASLLIQIFGLWSSRSSSTVTWSTINEGVVVYSQNICSSVRLCSVIKSLKEVEADPTFVQSTISPEVWYALIIL